jgi:hypothetical protein
VITRVGARPQPMAARQGYAQWGCRRWLLVGTTSSEVVQERLHDCIRSLPVRSASESACQWTPNNANSVSDQGAITKYGWIYIKQTQRQNSEAITVIPLPQCAAGVVVHVSAVRVR